MRRRDTLAADNSCSGTAPPPPAAPGQTNELRQRYGSVAARAARATNDVTLMERRLSGQGLGLRADILEARDRLKTQVRTAAQAMGRGDTDQASQSLEWSY